MVRYWSILPVSFRVTSLALATSYNPQKKQKIYAKQNKTMYFIGYTPSLYHDMDTLSALPHVTGQLPTWRFCNCRPLAFSFMIAWTSCWTNSWDHFRGHDAHATSLSGLLQWRHNERDGISNHQPHDCLLNHLFRCRSKKTSKLHVTVLCAGNYPHKEPVMQKILPFVDIVMLHVECAGLIGWYGYRWNLVVSIYGVVTHEHTHIHTDMSYALLKFENG